MARQRYLSQAVSFAEGLVGHVPELLGHSTWAPTGGVVLDHGCHKLRHFFKLLERRKSQKKTPKTRSQTKPSAAARRDTRCSWVTGDRGLVPAKTKARCHREGKAGRPPLPAGPVPSGSAAAGTGRPVCRGRDGEPAPTGTDGSAGAGPGVPIPAGRRR